MKMKTRKLFLAKNFVNLFTREMKKILLFYLKPKSKIIGNELILFVQPSISSLLFKNPSKPQIEEIKIEEKIGRNNNIVEMEEEVEDNFLDLKSSIQSKENYLKEGEDNFEEMDIG
uniref:Candidate secreted effector n=1 Tax=Meloidogyne incognita TaxID=6306 RepID=A0A914P1M5_MELIC